MEYISTKTAVLTAFGAGGGFLIAPLGGSDMALKTLIFFMAIDYITGLLVAGVFQKSTKTENGALESKAGFKGLCRKFTVLLIVAMAFKIDQLAGTDVVRYAVIIGYVGNESISIFENVGLMGVSYPEKLKKAIDVLTEKKEN